MRGLELWVVERAVELRLDCGEVERSGLAWEVGCEEIRKVRTGLGRLGWDLRALLGTLATNLSVTSSGGSAQQCGWVAIIAGWHQEDGRI